MRMRSLLATTALLAACGPSIQSARFQDVSPGPSADRILLFSSKLPECPYEEVGLITGKSRGFWTSLESVLEGMRDHARDMGGDAIVGLGTSEVVTGGSQAGNSVNVHTADRLTGTVVRFSDPDCRQ